MNENVYVVFYEVEYEHGEVLSVHKSQEAATVDARKAAKELRLSKESLNDGLLAIGGSGRQVLVLRYELLP